MAPIATVQHGCAEISSNLKFYKKKVFKSNHNDFLMTLNRLVDHFSCFLSSLIINPHLEFPLSIWMHHYYGLAIQCEGFTSNIVRQVCTCRRSAWIYSRKSTNRIIKKKILYCKRKPSALDFTERGEMPLKSTSLSWQLCYRKSSNADSLVGTVWWKSQFVYPEEGLCGFTGFNKPVISVLQCVCSLNLRF